MARIGTGATAAGPLSTDASPNRNSPVSLRFSRCDRASFRTLWCQVASGTLDQTGTQV